MDLLKMAEALEADALTLAETALGDPLLATGYRRDCYRTALVALDLAQRLGAAATYPRVYGPLKKFQDFK